MSDRVSKGPPARPFASSVNASAQPTERATPTRHEAEEAIASGQSMVSPEHVAMAAYYRAARRGFAPGREVEDWLEAEQDLQNAPDSEDVSGS